MIEIPLMAKAAGSFIRDNWRLIAALVLAAGVAFYLVSIGKSIERAEWQPKNAALELALQVREQQLEDASREAEAQRLAVERAVAARQAEIVAHYQERIHAGNAALAAAVERVRVASAARPRAPAAAAPAACGDYEALPGQLSQPDREFLVRLAAEADAVVVDLELARRYALTLYQQCSAAPGEK